MAWPLAELAAHGIPWPKRLFSHDHADFSGSRYIKRLERVYKKGPAGGGLTGLSLAGPEVREPRRPRRGGTPGARSRGGMGPPLT
jgi:hypothetical protein